MKRSIFTLFLTLGLFALCAVPSFAEEAPVPSFEERKEMAIEASIPDIQMVAEDQNIEWNPETLTAEAYPSRGMLGVLPEYHLTAQEVAETANYMMLLFYSDNQPLLEAFARYMPESNSMKITMIGGSNETVQETSRQIERFNQIKTPDSPICIISNYSTSYIYGNTIYGDNMMMDVSPYSDDWALPYFQSMDTGDYPLIYVEDFELMMKEAEKHPDLIGGIPLFLLPQYNHAMIVRNRWIFGTAGVLLLVGFIGYRIYRAKQQAKAE